MKKKSAVKKKKKTTKTKIKTSLEEKVYYDVSMNEQNFETFFLSYKIKYFQSSVTSIIYIYIFKKKKNLDGKLLKISKKLILVVDPRKTSYNLSLKFYCENIVKVILR